MIFPSDESDFKAGRNFCPARVSAETQAVGGDTMRRRFNDRKIHAFLNVSVAPGVDINRVFRIYASRETPSVSEREDWIERTGQQEE
jgi:hypothetical protein